MDPVSVFKALYDTKCLKFGRFELKSGLVAPYYMNLRRLPLYPILMEAVVSQVVEKFLTNQALQTVMCTQVKASSWVQLAAPVSKTCKAAKGLLQVQSNANESDADNQLEEDEAVEATSSSDDGDWEKVNDNFDPVICGVPYGAIPIASAIAYKARLPYLFERKEAKMYGDVQSLMDDFDAGTRSVDKSDDYHRKHQALEKNKRRQQVILIEDVICSGESILDTVRTIEKRNQKVEFVICIVDREENGVNLLLKQAGIRVLPLYSMSAILRVLETTDRITNEQFIKTRQWMTKNQFKSIGVDPTVRSLLEKSRDADSSPEKLVPNVVIGNSFSSPPLSPNKPTIEVAAN